MFKPKEAEMTMKKLTVYVITMLFLSGVGCSDKKKSSSISSDPKAAEQGKEVLDSEVSGDVLIELTGYNGVIVDDGSTDADSADNNNGIQVVLTSGPNNVEFIDEPFIGVIDTSSVD